LPGTGKSCPVRPAASSSLALQAEGFATTYESPALAHGLRLNRQRIAMSQAVHNPTQEFWQPPVTHPQSMPALESACAGCGSEFMIGARFCHVCGASRSNKSAATVHTWMQPFLFFKALEFQNLRDWLGLSLASLIAFFTGVGCILAALVVGLVYSAQNLADFQAIQLWRLEWLLAALVAFVAGILLKHAGSR
jgi:hypothetical protein